MLVVVVLRYGQCLLQRLDSSGRAHGHHARSAGSVGESGRALQVPAHRKASQKPGSKAIARAGGVHYLYAVGWKTDGLPDGSDKAPLRTHFEGHDLHPIL